MRIGTRGSALARAQAQLIANRLPGAQLVVVSTSGDRGERTSDKARWVDAIEQALLCGEIDLAVHSAKDVPSQLADGLELVGCPPRADARDALCGAASIADLPEGARVGTSSLRRAAQLRALREDIEPVALRGNVDTRLRRLSEAQSTLHAIVLARAGLQRLGHDDGTPLDELVPAAGQGTLALEARVGDKRIQEAVAPLRDSETELALAAERSLVRALDADCHTALGAHARVDRVSGCGRVELEAWIGLQDGSAWIADKLVGEDPNALGKEVAQRMLTMGAREMLSA
ncbi:MAG: hydroxymethylbilane synthase [Solirubrobacteraceae bacterium]